MAELADTEGSAHPLAGNSIIISININNGLKILKPPPPVFTNIHIIYVKSAKAMLDRKNKDKSDTTLVL
ncbi:MAG: hypothetical protein IJN99_04305 [Clostridia bacterium]|nr:hypothetical protein [Clostridia bacterium]